MPDFRTLKRKKILDIPIIESYRINRDLRFYGFNVSISWRYSSQAAAFRIYKAKRGSTTLKRNYLISNLALTRFASIKNFPLNNTILYNKAVFGQNSKVKFEKSDSNRFDTAKTDLTTYNFREIKMIRANNNGFYTFVDRNVKFGESYAYVITALGSDFIESGKSNPVIVDVEDIIHPHAPDYFSAKRSNLGILLTIGASDKDDDVVAFDVYKRKKGEIKYEFFDQVKKEKKERFINYLDTSVFPGFVYEYKVYSIDLFGNISYEAKYDQEIFDVLVERKGDIPFPETEIKFNNNAVYISVFKNHKNIIGAIIERQDVWQFEKGFTQKTNNGNKWQRIVFFGENGEAEQIDLSAKIGRIYRYRISTIKPNGQIASYFITPYLKIKEGILFSNKTNRSNEESSKISIRNFDVEIEEKKRIPPLVKLSWQIDGNWDYLIIKYEDKNIRVDNIHTSIILNNLEKGKKYIFSIEVKNLNGDTLAVSKEATLIL